MNLPKNVGNVDRIIRIVLAAVLVVLYFTGVVTGTLGIVFLVVAVVFGLTAVFGYCPIYYVFKLSTAG